MMQCVCIRLDEGEGQSRLGQWRDRINMITSYWSFLVTSYHQCSPEFMISRGREVGYRDERARARSHNTRGSREPWNYVSSFPISGTVLIFLNRKSEETVSVNPINASNVTPNKYKLTILKRL